jgi:glucose/arabinose dehydrogenase
MRLRLRAVSAVGGFLILPAILSAQVIGITHGQKPQLPAPYATKSAGNGPHNTAPPPDFLPTVPQGFKINVFAGGFKTPRWLTVAPNGDIFLAETGANQIVVMRDPQHTGEAKEREIFATGTRRVFGIAFKDDYVYVGDTNELVRFRYDPKTSKRLGEAESLLKLPTGGHETRTVAIAPDGKHVYVTVGSGSNISTGEDPIRAALGNRAAECRGIGDPTGYRSGMGDGQRARRTGRQSAAGLFYFRERRRILRLAVQLYWQQCG